MKNNIISIIGEYIEDETQREALYNSIVSYLFNTSSDVCLTQRQEEQIQEGGEVTTTNVEQKTDLNFNSFSELLKEKKATSLVEALEEKRSLDLYKDLFN